MVKERYSMIHIEKAKKVKNVTAHAWLINNKASLSMLLPRFFGCLFTGTEYYAKFYRPTYIVLNLNLVLLFT